MSLSDVSNLRVSDDLNDRCVVYVSCVCMCRDVISLVVIVSVVDRSNGPMTHLLAISVLLACLAYNSGRI